jgi:hypothetical protein
VEEEARVPMESSERRTPSQAWGLKPVIPATREAEVGRIAVQGQPSQTFMKPHLN